MTKAICLRCGGPKHGALLPCNGCDFEPATSEERAKSILLTDHFFDLDTLGTISARIRSGRVIHFAPDALQSMISSVEEGPSQDELWPPRTRRRGWVYVASVVVLAAIAIGVSILWLRG